MAEKKKLILASASPRRHEILESVGLSHEISVPDVDETVDGGLGCEDAVKEIARRKALAALGTAPVESVVLAADTMVEVDGKALGKPTSGADACRMLESLSGKTHRVFTGIAVSNGKKTVSEAVCTSVIVRELRRDEIEGYVATGEPLDKAGAYGIQGIGGAFVSHIDGDYFNVVGLPICRVVEILRDFGISLFE